MNCLTLRVVRAVPAKALWARPTRGNISAGIANRSAPTTFTRVQPRKRMAHERGKQSALTILAIQNLALPVLGLERRDRKKGGRVAWILVERCDPRRLEVPSRQPTFQFVLHSCYG